MTNTTITFDSWLPLTEGIWALKWYKNFAYNAGNTLNTQKKES